MDIFKNFSLKEYNTFRIEAYADYFTEIKSVDKLIDLFQKSKYKKQNKLVLGGGSNLLFTQDVRALVIHPVLKGIELVEEGSETVLVKVAAGEIWDDFVQWAVKNNFSGVENLSLIPGTVGAAPVQNIGAYGVEVKDIIRKVEALEIETTEVQSFSNQECAFAYRDSVFKSKYKGKYLITSVYFELQKNPVFHLDYGNLKKELQQFEEINLQSVRQAVINIRQAKLPNPEELPNAGSFFKNPVVEIGMFEKLKKQFPKIVSYPQGEAQVKIAAGWLIDYCGLKGYRQGDAGVHKNQALVLVNYGNASGKDILNLAEYVRKRVYNTFGIQLDFEVNIL